MDNMGGLRKLYYTMKGYITSIVLQGNNSYGLIFENGNPWQEIPFTSDTGKLSETGEMTDNGMVYNYEAICRIPKSGPDTWSVLFESRLMELIFLAEDNNGNFRITGYPGTYFNIVLTDDTGENTQDRNSTQLRVSAALPVGSFFATDPFNSLIS